MIDEVKLHSPQKKYIKMGIMITLAIGIVSLMPILIRNKGQYMDFGDYYQQYIPFIKELKRMLLSGNLLFQYSCVFFIILCSSKLHCAFGVSCRYHTRRLYS